ncbi:ABC transporter permease [Bacillus sp. CLL-7-23]|uniref:ABC transporter permease n=1 Tax=Bacillus changyiensis TaxID=3004103 RepID=A0ABT4X4S0_9BACI|nr:ABC transporter permease [Bacillus changyiensis]MDA7027289.1 ABC transporter permease [Bacillus changyiensis]
MNGRKLFLTRLKADYRYQLRVLGSVIDWTIALYLILPVIAIGGYQYFSLLNGSVLSTGVWFSKLILLIPSIFTLFGSIRTLLMEADQLYLLQKKTLIVEIKRCGAIYCLLIQICKWLVLLALFIPILVKLFPFNLFDCITIFFFYFSVNLFIIAVKRRCVVRNTKKFGQILAIFFGACAVVLSTSVYFILIVGLLLATTAVKIYFDSLSHLFVFYQEVENEMKHKLRFVNLILLLNQDGSVPKLKRKTRAKKPRLLFTKSQKLFKTRTIQNGYREVFFKVFLRHDDYKGQLFRIIGGFTALIILGPIWMKLMALLLFAYVYHHLISIQFDQVMEHSYLLGADHDSDAFYKAKRNCINWLYYPGLIWCCLVSIISTFVGVSLF